MKVISFVATIVAVWSNNKFSFNKKKIIFLVFWFWSKGKNIGSHGFYLLDHPVLVFRHWLSPLAEWSIIQTMILIQVYLICNLNGWKQMASKILCTVVWITVLVLNGILKSYDYYHSLFGHKKSSIQMNTIFRHSVFASTCVRKSILTRK